MKKVLRLSIITPTLNAGKILEHFFKSVEAQNYPKVNIEVLIVDGGSNDSTLPIAKKHHARIIPNPEKLAEPGVYHGMQAATGDILVVLATDNIFVSPNAFQEIAEIFSDPTIYAVYPTHASAAQDSIYSKYVNMFTDPFNHFVYWDASNARTYKKVFSTLKHTNTYDIYDFKMSTNKPILALAQGFSVRRAFISQRKEKMDDIVSVLEMIHKRKLMAYAYPVLLYHHTIRDLDHFVRKQRWTARNALNKKEYGIAYRERSLTTGQRIRAYLFIPYSLTILFPALVSIYKALKERNSIWLLHPLMTWLSAFSITWEILIKLVKFNKDISKQ